MASCVVPNSCSSTAAIAPAATQWAQAIKKDHEEIDVMVKQGGTFWAASAEEAAPFRKAVESVVKSFESRYPDAMKAHGEIVKRHGG